MWVFNALGIVLICGSVIFLAYSSTRFISSKAGKLLKGKNLSIVESLGLGFDKQIHLVKVGEKYILLSTSGKNVHLLTELTPSEIGEIDVQTPPKLEGFDFKEIFEKYVGALQNKITTKPLKKKNDSYLTHTTKDKVKTGENLERIKAINRRFMDQ